jgi:hypothetical protein
MPSYNLNLADPQTVLRILVTLVEQNGDELHFKAEDYDGLDKGKVLSHSYDKKGGMITLRVSSDNGGAVVVQPEAHQWTQPAQSAPLERARTEATKIAQRRAVPSDEELADMEEAAQRSQNLAAMEAEGKAPLRINIKK